MKGFVQGSLWGLIVGGAVLGIASQVNELPEFAQGPAVPQLDVPDLRVEDTAPAADLQLMDDDAPVVVQTTAPTAPAATAEAAPVVRTVPATPPAAPVEVAAVAAPSEPEEPEVVVEVDTPVAQVPATNLSAAQTTLEAPVVEVSPPPAVAVAVPEEAKEEPQAPVVVADQTETVPTAEVATQTLSPTVEEDTVPELGSGEDTAEASPAAEVISEATTVTVPEPVDVQEPETPAVTPVVDETPEPASAPVVVAQALPQTQGTVKVNRLGVAPQEDAVEDAAPEQALPDDAPALLRFAAPFESDAGVAQIAFILLDSGQIAAPADAIANLGFTPTIAIDALSEGAAGKMADIRNSNGEVALVADLPQGARPTDVEVTFAAAFAAMPEVALVFSDGTGAMQDRAVTAQVMDILSADGRGFVSVQRGLSNAAREAAQRDVPAATVLRKIDESGAGAAQMMRELDRAALRARQSGQVVLLGDLTPATLDVLREWSAKLDRDTVTIAPVSALLLKGTE